MADTNRLSFESLVNFDETTLTANYQAINGAGTTVPLIAFKFYNSSSDLILLSFDGSTDEDFIPPGATFIFDSETNADSWGDGNGGHKSLAVGTVVYAKTSSNVDRLMMVGYH